MDYRSILNIHIVAYSDIMYIAPDHRIKPNATIVAHFYFANYCCVFGKEAIFSKFGSYTFYRSY
jgi:hypothetical protein